MREQPNARFSTKLTNLEKALEALEIALFKPISEPRDLAGIIQNFEIVYELSWTTMKAFLEGEGHTVRSARDAFAKAYQLQYLGDEEIWLDMIKKRNLTVHTYNQGLAEDLGGQIRNQYLSAFKALLKSLKTASSNQ